MKTRWLVLPLVVGMFLVGFLGVKLMGPNPMNDSQVALTTMPFNTFKTVTGEDFSFQSLLGKRYVVHVWSSWCSSCDYDHQTLMSNVTTQMTLIGITYRDKSDAAMKYLMQYGNPYEAVLDDESSQLAQMFRIGVVPMTFWVSEKGEIVHQATGLLTHHDTDLLKRWATPGVGPKEIVE